MTEPQMIRKIENHIFSQLPDILGKDPRFTALVEGIVSERFPTKEDFNRLVDEVQEMRRSHEDFRVETRHRFDQTDMRISRVENEVQEMRRSDEEFRSETRERSDQTDMRIDRLENEMKDGFRKVDKRFDQIDQRFEQVDERFDQIDQRFEQVDERFDQIDQRFEKVDERFDQIDQRFEKVDERFEKADDRMNNFEKEMKEFRAEVQAGFHDMLVHIDRLGSRWGIRNEKLFRQTMKAVIEDLLGMTVEECIIRGEQFDCVISNGKHILIEITASAKPNIHERLIRKRELYAEETGIEPSRFLLAVGSIHSKRAEALRADGFEVIEPED